MTEGGGDNRARKKCTICVGHPLLSKIFFFPCIFDFLYLPPDGGCGRPLLSLLAPLVLCDGGDADLGGDGGEGLLVAEGDGDGGGGEDGRGLDDGAAVVLMLQGGGGSGQSGVADLKSRDEIIFFLKKPAECSPQIYYFVYANGCSSKLVSR